MKQRNLLTTKLAAQMLGFTQDWVTKLCREGKIEAKKYGHDWIISEQALKNIKRRRFIKEKKDGSKQ